MFNLLTKILLLMSLFATSGVLLAETSIWKAQKDGQTIYLGGTIHLLRATDYPLPAAFEQAYAKADILVFETDISQLSSPEMTRKMILALSYDDTRTIASEVNPETYAALKSYAESFGISLDYMRKAKPGLLMSTLMVMELKKLGVGHEGIDIHFQNRAKKDAKKSLYFETPEQQIEFLAQLGVGDENAFYQNLLRDLKNTETLFLSLIKYWRAGDSKSLDIAVNQEMKKITPKIYQSLLVNRNRNWQPLIEGYFATPEVEFVLVGAAHLIGEDGLVAALKAKGYQLTQM